MFEKLLSLLPYNPALTHQLRFYASRMREEAAIRRTGLVFLVLTFMVQFFAVLSPVQPAAASSDNDLITGGVSSASDAFNQCENNTRGYQVIMHYYGISCDAFKGAPTVIIHTGAENYYSMGHDPTGAAGEVSVAVCNGSNCAGTMYWRPMSIWPEPHEGPGGSLGWKTLQLHNQDGRLFYVMFDCGNLVAIGVPGSSPLRTPTPTPTPPPTPTPAPAPAPTPSPTPTPTPAPTPTPTPTPCPYNPSVPNGSALCYPPCQYNSTLSATDVECKPCEQSISSQDKLACIEVHKTAANITENISDANNTTAQAGDVILYTLYAQNTGKADVTGYIFQENINDVLAYANITDLHGGIQGANGIISWPKQEIKAGQTASVQLTVQVKNPIPDNPPAADDPTQYDLTMTNVYGNTINIKVPSPPTRIVATATTGSTASLPNTGPGASLFIAAAVVMVAAYFYGRARLLARESELAIHQNANA